MDYAKFQVAVVELAGEGKRLTTANVVGRLRVSPAEAESKLDQMAREGRLDLEVDEDEGSVFYQVPGLVVHAEGRSRSAATAADQEAASVQALLRDAAIHAAAQGQLGLDLGSSKGAMIPPSMRRKVPVGALLGGVFPGLGLAYAAPWSTVLLATLGIYIGWKVLLFVSLFLAVPFLLGAVVVSAIAGGVYAYRYNQTGRRTPLFAAERRLEARLRDER